MSKQTPRERPYEVVHLANGTPTLIRKPDPHAPPHSDLTLPISVLSKDLTINPSNNTSLRLFLPNKSITSNQNKLPLIVFFHGSGFIVLSAASTVFHDFCVQLADAATVVVASVDYRLAPEHRLPAAYDDAVEALHWIKSSEDEWLTKYVDYSRCYLMGNSAGATIAYYAGLRAAKEGVADLEPLKIQGLILRQPFFGGRERSESELRLENDSGFPLCEIDMLWELALPVGADRDHEYANPTVGDGVRRVEKVRDERWRVLVSGNGEDPLVAREKELVRLLEEKGVLVESDFEDEGSHGVEYADPNRTKRLVDLEGKLRILPYDGAHVVNSAEPSYFPDETIIGISQ